VTVTHSGATKKYIDNFEKAFGKGTVKSATKKTAKKAASAKKKAAPAKKKVAASKSRKAKKR